MQEVITFMDLPVRALLGFNMASSDDVSLLKGDCSKTGVMLLAPRGYARSFGDQNTLISGLS